MNYLVKKLVGLAITLFIVSIVTFLIFDIIPGDPARQILGMQATEERVLELQKEMGLNRPLPIRYIEWVLNFVRGDMGTSFTFGIPVNQIIGERIPVTIAITLMSMMFILILAVPFGLLGARFEGKLPDKFMLVVNQVVMSIPPFFIGILFTFIFGLVLRWFVPGGYVSYTQSVMGFLGYLVFPSLAIALPRAAMTTKVLRNTIISEMEKDYVKTAKSRGSSQNRIMVRHVLKNAFIPIITFLGMTIADIIAGSIVIEQVFGIPGVGRILITSIANRDYPVVQAIIVLIAMATLVINAIVDILYNKFDKRIEV